MVSGSVSPGAGTSEHGNFSGSVRLILRKNQALGEGAELHTDWNCADLPSGLLHRRVFGTGHHIRSSLHRAGLGSPQLQVRALLSCGRSESGSPSKFPIGLIPEF